MTEKKKQNRKQFVLYGYTNFSGNFTINILREDLMPLYPTQVLMIGTYSACAKKMQEGWTKEEKAGINSIPVMYKKGK